ncbi:Vms1/Ankzf1 family peptidyl-tRNA hydrolase [Haloferacaceae archaeon DSL9]
MLDALLGRAELKARIEELEEEKRHLERRAEAESERRAEAVSARQDAEERVNRLEDRIAELEDRVERLGSDEPDLDFRDRRDLRGDPLREVLGRLRSVETEREGALTAFVADGSLPEPVETTAGAHVSLVRRAAPAVVCVDDAGLVSVALSPPLPPEPFCEWDDGFRLPDEWFLPTGAFAFGVVRSDLFALGRYDGSTRRSFTGFESDVKSDHSKGGFSQGRFERIREGQIDAHLDRVREAIRECDAERLILVGERTVLSKLRDLADHTAAVDAGGEPEDALDHAFRDFWTTRLYAI